MTTFDHSFTLTVGVRPASETRSIRLRRGSQHEQSRPAPCGPIGGMHRLCSRLLRASTAATATACATFALSDVRAPSFLESGAGVSVTPSESEHGADGTPSPGSFASYVGQTPGTKTESPMPSPPPAFIPPNHSTPLVSTMPDPEPVVAVHQGESKSSDTTGGLARRETEGTSRIVMAGDCGGTNTRLQLYRVPAGSMPEIGGRPPGTLILARKFVNSEYDSFAHVSRRRRAAPAAASRSCCCLRCCAPAAPCVAVRMRPRRVRGGGLRIPRQPNVCVRKPCPAAACQPRWMVAAGGRVASASRSAAACTSVGGWRLVCVCTTHCGVASL